MKIRFVRNITLQYVNSSNESDERFYRKWDEVKVISLEETTKNFFDIILENGNILYGVPQTAFEKIP